MRRHAAFAIGAISVATAQAADTVVTLACQGTTTITSMDDPKALPISVGIMINLTKRTLEGLGWEGAFPLEITSADEVTITFHGSTRGALVDTSTYGSMDRVTGELGASVITTNLDTGNIVTSKLYSLKCRPAQRMF